MCGFLERGGAADVHPHHMSCGCLTRLLCRAPPSPPQRTAAVSPEAPARQELPPVVVEPPLFTEAAAIAHAVELSVLQALSELPETPWSEVAASSDSEAEECSLCMECFCVSDAVRQLPCGHYFHPHCIGSWFDVQARKPRTCPVCQALVLSYDPALVFRPGLGPPVDEQDQPAAEGGPGPAEGDGEASESGGAAAGGGS